MIDITAVDVQRHYELTSMIKEREYAPPKLIVAQDHLSAARERLAAERDKLERHQERTKARYTIWTSLQSSKTSRLLVKVRRSTTHEAVLAARVEDLRAEYKAAFADEQACLERVGELEEREAELVDCVDDLSQLATRHAELSDELEGLYARVFAGPSTEHPEEDEAESVVNIVAREVNELEDARLNAHCVLELLHGKQGKTGALACAERAERHFREAQQANGQGQGSDRAWHKRKGEDNFSAARRLLGAAVEKVPRIPEFTGQLPKPDYYNPAHTERQRMCRRLATHIRTAILHQQLSITCLTTKLETARSVLDESKAELEDVRRRIMDEYARDMGIGTAPPLYSQQGCGEGQGDVGMGTGTTGTTVTAPVVLAVEMSGES